VNAAPESPPEKPGCTEPRSGAELSRRLGTPLPLPAHLAAHVQTCPACQLEHQTFAALDDAAAPIPDDFTTALRSALARQRS